MSWEFDDNSNADGRWSMARLFDGLSVCRVETRVGQGSTRGNKTRLSKGRVKWVGRKKAV